MGSDRAACLLVGYQDLAAERREDLQNNAELFSTFIGDFPLKGRSGGK
jgi:hypothetical protein